MIDEITNFVNWLRRRNPQARTWRDYGYDLNQFVAIVGDKPPASVTIQDIDNFITAQAERGLKPTSINRHLAAIMALYTFLADEDPDLVCPMLPHRHTLRATQRLPRPVHRRHMRCCGVLPPGLEQRVVEVEEDQRPRIGRGGSRGRGRGRGQGWRHAASPMANTAAPRSSASPTGGAGVSVHKITWS